MQRRDHSPGPPMSRGALVIGLYAGMSLLALLIAAGRGDPTLVLLGGASSARLALGPPVGLAAGLLVVALSRAATRRYAWAQALHNSFRDLLGALTGREIVIVAAASSLGEELLFRGALLPWLGLWPQAALFALLHVGPGRRFLPWTVAALALALGFGVLAEQTGSLAGPILAHATINLMNLRYIVRAPARSATRAASRADAAGHS
jgi:membrane protease YdiL (CAAX protease family)